VTVEFDCGDCGMHVVQIVGEVVPNPALCAECIALPGWFNDPQLRKMLDPGGWAKPTGRKPWRTPVVILPTIRREDNSGCATFGSDWRELPRAGAEYLAALHTGEAVIPSSMAEPLRRAMLAGNPSHLVLPASLPTARGVNLTILVIVLLAGLALAAFIASLAQ
jgi:hypothetical protein